MQPWARQGGGGDRGIDGAQHSTFMGIVKVEPDTAAFQGAGKAGDESSQMINIFWENSRAARAAQQHTASSPPT